MYGGKSCKHNNGSQIYTQNFSETDKPRFIAGGYTREYCRLATPKIVMRTHYGYGQCPVDLEQMVIGVYRIGVRFQCAAKKVSWHVVKLYSPIDIIEDAFKQE